MLDISMDNKFDVGWVTRKSGAGVVEVFGGVLRTYSNVQGDAAMKDYYFPVAPGSIVELEIWAKDNGSSIKPRISIDNVSSTTDYALLDYIEVENSGEWGLYRLRVDVPFNTTKPYVRITLGKWSSMSGVDCSYKNPVIKVSNSGGASRVVAMGLIKVTNGEPSIHASFQTLGIKSMTYDVSLKCLDVFVDFNLIDANNLLGYPVPFVSSTGDSPLIANIGNVVKTVEGLRFRIRWTDGTQIVDVSTKTVYVFFKAEV